MRREDQVRLRHMVDAAEDAMRFVEGRSREDLDSDRLLAFAVPRALEILGEAASKIAPESRLELAQVSWVSIIGLRDRLAHAYFEINMNDLWRTATEELPRLLPLLRAALAGDDAPP